MNDTDLITAKILIADDDVSHVCLLVNFLGRLGYKNLKSVTDSRKIFDEMKEFKPDIILLDLNMPHLSGFDILASLKESYPGDSFIPVLVLTGDGSPQNKRRALAAGATDLIEKPFDPSEFLMRIRNLLRSSFLRMEIQNQNSQLEQIVAARTSELEHALSELKETQRQMVQQERLRAFGEMAGGVVHDFNNVLMAVIGYSDLLLKDPKLIADPVVVREYLEVIHGAGRDASDVVGRLRDFYRPRGKTDVFEEVDLNKVIESAVALTQPKWKDQALAGGRQITMDLDFEKLPRVAANASELREVVTNLIFNAVDSMPKRGVITLRTRRAEAEIMFEISDTGIGMGEEVRTRCMEPFFTTKGEEGSGLGLSMVFGIIKRHEGTLEIESSEGVGTIFRIFLPSHSGAAGVVPGEEHAAGRPLNVLVADDDSVARDIVTKYLLTDSHRVTTFTNGIDAMDGFKASSFDLLIIDHGMPGMNGVELAGLVRQMRNGQPIILLTGFNERELPSDIQQRGIDMILYKPVSQGELRHAMAAVMKGK
jgi:signal transduction histidine kinase